MTHSCDWQVLVHFLELVSAISFVCIFYWHRVEAIWEEQPRALCYFFLSNVSKYLLFFFLRTFCAYPATCSSDFPLAKILSDEAIDLADDADRRVPLQITTLASFSLAAADRHKLFTAMTTEDAEMKRDRIAGNVCHLVSRLSQGKTIQEKERLTEEGAAEAVLAAMEMQLDDDAGADCPVSRRHLKIISNFRHLKSY